MSFDDREGMVKVDPERCETVDFSDHLHHRGGPSCSLAATTPTSNPLFRFFESNFGGEGQRKTNKQQLNASVQEMEDLDSQTTVRLVQSYNRDTVGGFDICREYSYSGDEDENNYFVDSKPADISGTSKVTVDGEGEEVVVRAHVLGQTYHPIRDYNARRDFESSLFWFTYRCGFPEIAPYNITSDAGWGCMLRSSQMLLAHALRLHYKSREWKPAQQVARRRQDPFVRSLMTWFADYPSTTEHLYSIHNMVATGLAKYDKLPGEWYGPGTVCYVLRDLVELHERQQAAGRGATTAESRRIFRVYVAPQSSVYRDSIEELMTRDGRARRTAEREEQPERKQLPAHPLDAAWEDELIEPNDSLEWDTALLLLIPLRLGLKSFNEDYVQAIAHTFSLRQSVGGLGGRPRSARWFYGAVSDGSKIFGLDPHTVQNAPRKRHAQVNGKSSSVVELSEDYLRSVHTTYPEVFSLQKMDPSMALGFYCRDRKDLEHLFSSIQAWRSEHPGSPSLFSVFDAVPDYSADVSSALDSMTMSRMAGSLLDGDDGQVSDEDEYVML